MEALSIRQVRSAFFLLLLVLPSCEETHESEKESLALTKERILAYVNAGACTGDSQCRFAGIGSKPCGGPREYVVYSTSLDTTRLLQMIAEYNAGEDAFNRKWGLSSDCSVPPPPDSVGCLDGRCVGYWNGVPRL